MKKLLFLLPFCAAVAAAEESRTETVIYKPVDGTTSFEMKGTSNEMREGSWTNKTTGETSTAFFRPTRTENMVAFDVNDDNVTIDAESDTISVSDINWSHLSVSYAMPKTKPLTLSPGSSIEFSYSLSEANTKKNVTVTLEDKVSGLAIVTGSGSAGMGITSHVTCGDYYDNPNALVALESATDFKGVITCAEDGSYTLTFGSVAKIGTAEEEYSIAYTNTNLTSFTLSNVVISMDGGLSADLQQTIAPPALSNLTIKYTTTTPEPATATLSLLALAGLAARRRRK